jgi:hypothetical protein
MMKAAIQELDWEILSRPPYSPNLAPLDYHLFRSPFTNDAELQNWLDDFFRTKPADFFKRGIKNLPECWESRE